MLQRIFIFLVLYVITITANSASANSFKDQYCTDPRTMKKHAANTEWADAYSCTRHRCQPGGRNLAIYTVGCKRVEAPESAIECEEVVEDTNMQFPFCCTRLRCLVVVRGEVWTRVLGQPWESLPAAPWSHMYKMKKPPPADAFPKNVEGPIYELAETGREDKMQRPNMRGEDNYVGVIRPRSTASHPANVMPLATPDDKRERKGNAFINEESREVHNEDFEEQADKRQQQMSDVSSEEQQLYHKPAIHALVQGQESWTEQSTTLLDSDGPTELKEQSVLTDDIYHHEPEKESVANEKKGDTLQALVDAIAGRMRDIESVVQKMSEKRQVLPPDSREKRLPSDGEAPSDRIYNHLNEEDAEYIDFKKRANPEGFNYKRFTRREHAGTKHQHKLEGTTNVPLLVEDSNVNGYYIDGSTALQRKSILKEPVVTYMAPVENHRKEIDSITEAEDELKKHHKRNHRKKKSKLHKRHHSGTKEEKRKRFKGHNSMEVKKGMSIEDSSGVLSNKPGPVEDSSDSLWGRRPRPVENSTKSYFIRILHARAG